MSKNYIKLFDIKSWIHGKVNATHREREKERNVQEKVKNNYFSAAIFPMRTLFTEIPRAFT